MAALNGLFFGSDVGEVMVSFLGYSFCLYVIGSVIAVSNGCRIFGDEYISWGLICSC